MSAPSCYNCIYSVCDPELWLRWLWMGQSIVPQCANDPSSPGKLCDVTGIPCPNYRRKPPTPKGDIRMIPLADGFYAYVDAADYEWLSQWNWHMVSAGYAARREKGKTIFMHHMIMQPPKGMVVDHIDGSKANNCRFNLRVCTRKNNARNNGKRHGTSSRFKGVSYDKRRGKHYAQCELTGGKRWLGFFEDEVDAARAYDRAAVEACGEFARLNFPQEWPPEKRAQAHAQWLEAREKEQKNQRRTGGKPCPRAGKRGSQNTGKAKAKTKAKDKKAKGKRAGPGGGRRGGKPPDTRSRRKTASDRS